MCVSAEVSFGVAGLLVAGGAFALRRARERDARYIPLALFPVLVGVQQFMEGVVWVEAGTESRDFLRLAALGYLFFTWLVWPVWVPYMSARLEEETQKRRWFFRVAQAGFLLGLFLYLPNFWQPEWLNTEIVKHTVSYRCVLLSDAVLPRGVIYLLYLSVIALPLLLSSHRALNIFGLGLVLCVPLTYFFFHHAGISVLCFFAALATFYIFYVILEDRCGLHQRPKAAT